MPVSSDVPGRVPLRLWPLYVGGFLGPFGGAMVTPMLPELRDGLHTTLATAAWALTAYMIPFAAIMVVSGTLAERWGRHRTVRLAYVGYALASLVCALASTTPVFLLGRGLQGAANAFTSPLLVAAISDLVARERLGRSLGHYSSMQAAGQAFAPLVGGTAAALDYRLAFGASMLAAAALALVPPPDAGSTRVPERRESAGAPAGRWRVLLNPRLAVAAGTAFGLYLTTSGLLLLVALMGGDRFGLGPDGRGLVVAAFGLAGLVGGSFLGRLADRVGITRFGIGALLVLSAGTALTGQATTIIVLVALVAFGGAASTACRVVVNTLAVTSTPANRGGATSITLAWQFLGSALAPLVFLPIYRGGAGVGLLATAAGSVAAALVLLGGTRVRRAAAPEAASTAAA